MADGDHEIIKILGSIDVKFGGKNSIAAYK